MPLNRSESDVDVYFGVSKMQVLHPILWKLAKKIELATQLKTTNQWSAMPMQVFIVKKFTKVWLSLYSVMYREIIFGGLETILWILHEVIKKLWS